MKVVFWAVPVLAVASIFVGCADAIELGDKVLPFVEEGVKGEPEGEETSVDSLTKFRELDYEDKKDVIESVATRDNVDIGDAFKKELARREKMQKAEERSNRPRSRGSRSKERSRSRSRSKERASVDSPTKFRELDYEDKKDVIESVAKRDNVDIGDAFKKELARREKMQKAEERNVIKYAFKKELARRKKEQEAEERNNAPYEEGATPEEGVHHDEVVQQSDQRD